MGLLTLYSGLLLPWLGGTLWLAFADSRFNSHCQINRFRQAGYGFFLGYAVLFIAILAARKLTGAVPWTGLMVFLLLFSVSGGIAAWRYRAPAISVPGASQTALSNAMKILIGIVLVLMCIHLVFIAMEIFSQPVYPWDAWLAWVYRAKAWFMSGNITEVVSATDWAKATSANTYTIRAWRYPMFPSVIPYWAALSLGSWSETLINLPVLLAGFAIGMALFGQCREYGLGVPLSLIICYLLYSTPLFGTHIALAGYADIWMAGFTGLGFVALMRGVIMGNNIEKSRLQFVIGFSMIIFGMWVKNEGSVWLLAALAMLILANYRPRVPILLMIAASVMALLVFALGLTHIEIPLIGTLGFVDGHFVIPFIGSFALEMHAIQAVYWDNLIELGSWNLLWVLVTASVLLGFRSPNHISAYRARRTALSLILVFVATQLFIFGLTDQGLWADTYTAINRLPLHFVPALLFATVVIAHGSLNQDNSIKAGEGNMTRACFQSALVASLLAAIMVMASSLFYLSHDLPDQTGKPQQHLAKDFKFMFGSGRPAGKHMLVDEFSNGHALLSSGPVSIQADALRVLVYTWLPPETPHGATFFWRRSDDAGTVLRKEIPVPGTRLIDLSSEPDWQGVISEFGFLLAGSNDEVVEIGETLLLPDSLKGRMQLSWQAWTTFEEWSQQSINFLNGGDQHQVIALPLLVVAWLLATFVLLWLYSRLGKPIRTRHLLITAGTLFLIAWLLLDIRWSANNLRQMHLSLNTYWQTTDRQHFGTGLDTDIFQYIQELKNNELGDAISRILIVGDESAVDYHLLRAKYHLLPHSVTVAGRFGAALKHGSLDYVIFFGQASGITKTPGWDSNWRRSLIQVKQGEWGTLYRVK